MAGTGNYVEFSISLEDNADADMLSSLAIPSAIDYGSSNGWSIGFNIFTIGTSRRDFVDMVVTGSTATLEPSESPSGFRSAGPEIWLTAASHSQVPGATLSDGRRINASLWFNDFADVASLGARGTGHGRGQQRQPSLRRRGYRRSRRMEELLDGSRYSEQELHAPVPKSLSGGFVDWLPNGHAQSRIA